MAYKAKKKVARKVAATRTPREETGQASDELPESANAAPAPVVAVKAKVSNKEIPGTSGHQTVILRRYEWLDILDTIEGTDALAVAYDRISKQIS